MRLKRTSRTASSDELNLPADAKPALNSAVRPAVIVRPARLLNTWAVVPMRIFLGSLFLFAGYAMLTYPGFLDARSGIGVNQTLQAVKPRSPIGPALQPFIDHASVLGHVTAYAEFAIGAGLVLGALARIAAVGAIVLTTLIALTVHWQNVREYTGQSGWYTSVDIAIAVAMTVFVLGGAGPLSVDRGLRALSARRDAHDDAEPGFRDNEAAESRSRLQGDTTLDGRSSDNGSAQPASYPTDPQYPNQQYPDQQYADSAARYPAELPTSSFYPTGDRVTAMRTASPVDPASAGTATAVFPVEDSTEVHPSHFHEDPRGDVPGSLWTEGRRTDST